MCMVSLNASAVVSSNTTTTGHVPPRCTRGKAIASMPDRTGSPDLIDREDRRERPRSADLPAGMADEADEPVDPLPKLKEDCKTSHCTRPLEDYHACGTHHTPLVGHLPPPTQHT